MDRPFFRQQVQERTALLPRILSFNLDLARDIAPEHLNALPPALQTEGALSRLLSSTRARHRLSSHLPSLLGTAKTDTQYCFDFADPASRLALLDAQSLQHATRYFGICTNYASVTKAISKDAVAEAREALGEHDYAFALRRAPLLAGEGLDSLFPRSGSLAERITLHGRQGLAICLHGHSTALINRALLKLPSEWREAFDSVPETDDDGRRRIWHVFRRIVTKEVAPEWAPCFS